MPKKSFFYEEVKKEKKKLFNPKKKKEKFPDVKDIVVGAASIILLSKGAQILADA